MSMPLSAKSSPICHQNQKLFIMLPGKLWSRLQCFHENSIVRSSRFLIIEICQTDTYLAEPFLTQLFAGFWWLKFEICQIYGGSFNTTSQAGKSYKRHWSNYCKSKTGWIWRWNFHENTGAKQFYNWKNLSNWQGNLRRNKSFSSGTPALWKHLLKWFLVQGSLLRWLYGQAHNMFLQIQLGHNPHCSALSNLWNYLHKSGDNRVTQSCRTQQICQMWFYFAFEKTTRLLAVKSSQPQIMSKKS